MIDYKKEAFDFLCKLNGLEISKALEAGHIIYSSIVLDAFRANGRNLEYIKNFLDTSLDLIAGDINNARTPSKDN